MPKLTLDDTLAEPFSAGEPAAMNQVRVFLLDIVQRYRSKGVPRRDHEDVVQQTMTCLHLGLPTTEFRFRKSFEAYVRDIVHARCVDYLRNKHSKVELVGLDGFPDGTGKTAEEELLAKERCRLAEVALDRLGPAKKMLIRLHHLEDLSWKQIGELLGRPEGSLRVEMCHVLKEARRIFQQLERQGPSSADRR